MSMSDFAERLHALESRLDDMAQSNAKLEQERNEYKKLVHLLQEQNEKLKRGLLGQKAERLPKNDAQLSLSILQLALGGTDPVTHSAAADEAEESDEQTIAEHSRKKPVRKPLGEHWPRVTVEILPPEVQKEGLDGFERIGQETRRVLERRPASAVVVELVYPKFVRKDRVRNDATEVLVAPAVDFRSSEDWQAPACSRTPSSVDGRTTNRSIDWKVSTRARACRSRSPPYARGTRCSPRSRKGSWKRCSSTLSHHRTFASMRQASWS